MHDHSKILVCCPESYGRDCLGDHICRSFANNVHADDALGSGVYDNLHEAARVGLRPRSSVGRKGTGADARLNAFLRRAFLSFDLSRDRAQVFCVFQKRKLFTAQTQPEMNKRQRSHEQLLNFPLPTPLRTKFKIDRASGVRTSRASCARR